MDEQALLIVGHFTLAEDAAQLHDATLEHYVKEVLRRPNKHKNTR